MCFLVCVYLMDIGVIVDLLWSVGWKNYEIVKCLLVKLIEYFDVFKDGIYFGFIYYNEDVVLDFDFFDIFLYNFEVLIEKIMDMKYDLGCMWIDKVIKMVNERLFIERGGVR